MTIIQSSPKTYHVEFHPLSSSNKTFASTWFLPILLHFLSVFFQSLSFTPNVFILWIALITNPSFTPFSCRSQLPCLVFYFSLHILQNTLIITFPLLTISNFLLLISSLLPFQSPQVNTFSKVCLTVGLEEFFMAFL